MYAIFVSLQGGKKIRMVTRNAEAAWNFFAQGLSEFWMRDSKNDGIETRGSFSWGTFEEIKTFLLSRDIICQFFSHALNAMQS